MKRIALFVVLALLLAARPLPAETVSRIAAIVNQEVLTTAQLDRELNSLLSDETRREDLAPERLAELRRKVLAKMVEDTLVRQRIKQLGIAVSDEELERAIEDVQAKNKVTREQLGEALKAQGLTFPAYREQLRTQLLNFKLIGREVQSKVEITNQEMRDYYREHMAEFRTEPYIHLSRITFRIPAGAGVNDIAAQRAKAAAALGKLRQGEAFFQVLMQYATEPGVDGGDMGQFAEGSLSGAFNRALKKLMPGQYSDVIETAEAFHVLRLDDRNSGDTETFETVKPGIRDKLLEQKRQSALSEWAETLKKEADIETRL
jgi:peptidyl-prolyl cis-trans isomerase SurA